MKPIVKEFYSRVEQILVSNKFTDHGRSSELKSLVYKCLDEIIIDPNDVEFESSIGRGSSSEVFAGNYLYCPVAIKKIAVDEYTEKQLVQFF